VAICHGELRSDKDLVFFLRSLILIHFRIAESPSCAIYETVKSELDWERWGTLDETKMALVSHRKGNPYQLRFGPGWSRPSIF
jgi:hypothetical protein